MIEQTDLNILNLLGNVSSDLKRKAVQKHLNSWIKDLLQCEKSAFIMVTDDYGHCFCEVTGSKELGSPVSAGMARQWSDLLLNVKYLSYEEIPPEFRTYLRSIFDDVTMSSSLTIQPIRNGTANSSSIIAVLCILHSDPLSCSMRSKSFDDLLNLCNDTATSVIRICYSFEKQRSLTKLNGFILTLLRNVFSNLENMTELVQSIVKDAKKLIPSESCSLYLLDHENNELVEEVIDHDENQHEVLKEIRFPRGQGIAGQVAVSGNMVNIKHYVPESRIVGTEEETEISLKCARNVLCFAIKDKTAVIAVIQLVNKIDTEFYTDHDEHLAELLSSYCAISISHCLLFKRLHEAHCRSHLASELMMYHTQKIAEEDVLRLSLCSIPEPSSIRQDFLSFSFSPRSLSLHETHLACLTMFDDLGFIQKFRIKRKKLSRFLLLVEHGYRDVPYHNWYHAFTVTHFCYLLQKKLGIMSIYLSDVQRLSLLVACLCHDIDHRGTNNSFQLQSKTALAQLYSSEGSVLECHHFAQTMCIFNIEDCNIFAQLPSQTYQQILDNIRDIILATDLAQHLRVRPLIEEMAKNGYNYSVQHRYLLLCLLMTACDLADQTKPWVTSKTVAAQIYQEFFSQGDLEKAMGNKPTEMMDRERAYIPKLQLDFTDTIASPLFRLLGDMFPACRQLYKTICQNRLCYETMHKILTKNGDASLSRYDVDILLSKNLENEVVKALRSSNLDEALYNDVLPPSQ